MYVHAYQSYIWNLVVSERIKLSSTKPLVGDLVFDGDAEDKGESHIRFFLLISTFICTGPPLTQFRSSGRIG